MMVGGPGSVMLLATKPVVSVPVVAYTGYAPEIPFAVNGVAVATPELLVVMVNVTLKGVANPVPSTALWSDPSVGNSWLAPPGWMVSAKVLVNVLAPESTWTVKEPGIPLAVSAEEVI